MADARESGGSSSGRRASSVRYARSGRCRSNSLIHKFSNEQILISFPQPISTSSGLNKEASRNEDANVVDVRGRSRCRGCDVADGRPVPAAKSRGPRACHQGSPRSGMTGRESRPFRLEKPRCKPPSPGEACRPHALPQQRASLSRGQLGRPLRTAKRTKPTEDPAGSFRFHLPA